VQERPILCSRSFWGAHYLFLPLDQYLQCILDYNSRTGPAVASRLFALCWAAQGASFKPLLERIFGILDEECTFVYFGPLVRNFVLLWLPSPLALFCFGIRLLLLCPVLTTPSSPCFDQWNTLGGPSSSFPSISITRAKIWPFLKNQTSDPLEKFCGVLGYAGRVE
jgi:hypothetical protein